MAAIAQPPDIVTGYRRRYRFCLVWTIDFCGAARVFVVSSAIWLERAFRQEAILSAKVLVDRGAPCRGGPFACTKLYDPLSGLTAQVWRSVRLAAFRLRRAERC